MVDSLRIAHTSTGNLPDAERDPESIDREDAERDALYAKLRNWLEHERDRQAENRAEMAIDADFYDGLQWTEEDAQAIEARGQAPMVYNEIKVSIDWIIGAEKRNRVDWKVLPREASDQEGAQIKTKVLKYVSDVNRTPYTRSQAFAEAAISGLSWLEDSLSSDATEDPLYSGHETWRNVLHDSYHKRPDGKDMRYLFRWRYIDLDVAIAMWPKHEEALERAAMGADQLAADAEDELWYLGANLRDPNTARASTTRHLSMTGTSVESSRRRVKIYEAWYREPQKAQVMYGGAYHGELYDPRKVRHQRMIETGQAEAIPQVVLRMRVAFMTEGDLLEDAESPFDHNEFPLTPIYCFRRGRDGMPYGFVRPQRDPQMSMNKRISKALFLLSVNQLITEEGAFDTKGAYTLQDAIDNVANPQGVFVMKDGNKRFEIRRDYHEIREQTDILMLDRQFMQSMSGVTDELLGRRTNATSGEAIRARQEQGSITTSGIFDNYRLSISASGSKALSNCEKFYSMPKVIRLTEGKDKLDWVSINQPEMQPDGTVRFLNDITDTKADFIVDEQSYTPSMRMAMFDALQAMVKEIAPIAPAVAVGLLDLVIDAADFPGKDEMVQRVRQLIAEARGELKTPEQQAAEAEAAEFQKRAAAAKIALDEAKADETDAKADQIRAQIPLDAIALDLERTKQADATALKQTEQADARNQAQAELALSTAPASGAAAAPPPAPAVPGAGATIPEDPGMPAGQPAPAAAPDVPAALSELSAATGAALDAVVAALEQTQQTQAQLAQTQATIEQTRQDTLMAIGALAQEVAAAQKPRSKVISMVGPDGKPIAARVEVDANGNKKITMTNGEGKRVTATVAPKE